MQSITIAILIQLIITPVLSQSNLQLPVVNDVQFTNYYHQRVNHFNLHPVDTNDIVFLGNSITDGAEWTELFHDQNIKNRGISGDISAGILNRIGAIVKCSPKKIFLMIGTNDLARGISADSLIKNILLTVAFIKQESPSTQVFIQSILPVSNEFGKFAGHTSKRDSIIKVNDRLKKSQANMQYSFVDLYPYFCNQQGRLDKKFTNDGLHLLGEGYLLWKHLIYPHVYGLQDKPSIIPQPQNLNWTRGYFPLYLAKSIIFSDSTIIREAKLLKQIVEDKGWPIDLRKGTISNDIHVELRLDKSNLTSGSSDAYTLKVSESSIVLSANLPQGIFNGIQTLRQLMRDGVMVNACEITDWSAYAWRGYMVDVGRNYMSVKLLKEQIEQMAYYKLNVFHFHATEDIAWRFESKLYPQLNAPDNMLRNKGMYYTVEEIKELIEFCKDRYIQFVPEIDMPGHSAAFTRAFKTSMQSDSGLTIVKQLLNEFCDTYDLPYFHIGADEVKITNYQFIPEVESLLKQRGKKLIGWEPGGNFSSSVIRQLWMDDLKRISSDTQIALIDSRHLYLNHMDPLESVVTIYNRQIGGQMTGDKKVLGGVLCLWHDRNVTEQTDMLYMNPVYSGIVTFAERSWRGGGTPGWVANISDGNLSDFTEFEGRLLDHKFLFFNNKPFPYQKQTQLKWQIFGPYNNEGNIDSVFIIEKSKNKISANLSGYCEEEIGGTIILRHWWDPLIKGALNTPKENQTYYAVTSIWSDTKTQQKFWIGFNNLSRSTATDSPPLGAWDQKGSKVWVNYVEVFPPKWSRAGNIGHLETPLIDEGYEYRKPHRIQLNKGWNQVFIKLPMSSFKGKDWQNMKKWMFTFVSVADN